MPNELPDVMSEEEFGKAIIGLCTFQDGWNVTGDDLAQAIARLAKPYIKHDAALRACAQYRLEHIELLTLSIEKLQLALAQKTAECERLRLAQTCMETIYKFKQEWTKKSKLDLRTDTAYYRTFLWNLVDAGVIRSWPEEFWRRYLPANPRENDKESGLEEKEIDRALTVVNEVAQGRSVLVINA